MDGTIPTNATERQIDMVAIPGDTPEEIAANFSLMANARYASSEMRYCQNEGEMLRFAPAYINLRKIRDRYFMEVESIFYCNPVTETDD